MEAGQAVNLWTCGVREKVRLFESVTWENSPFHPYGNPKPASAVCETHVASQSLRVTCSPHVASKYLILFTSATISIWYWFICYVTHCALPWACSRRAGAGIWGWQSRSRRWGVPTGLFQVAVPQILPLLALSWGAVACFSGWVVPCAVRWSSAGLGRCHPWISCVGCQPKQMREEEGEKNVELSVCSASSILHGAAVCVCLVLCSLPQQMPSPPNETLWAWSWRGGLLAFCYVPEFTGISIPDKHLQQIFLELWPSCFFL